MPTPLGHALAGVAVAWAGDRVAPAARPSPASSTLPAVCALVAAAPDVDLFFGAHRTFSHSVAFAALVWIGAWLATRSRRLPAVRIATLCAAAYGSHLLLDWLGKDTSTPGGLMLWWPFTRVYSRSGVDLFAEVSRRYWDPQEFILGNLRSLALEVAILAPVLVVLRPAHRAHARRRV